MGKNTFFFVRLTSLTLLLSPVLMIYGWGKYDFALIFTSLLSILYILKNGINTNVLPKTMLLYLCYWFIIHIFTASSTKEVFSVGIIRVFLCFILYFSIKDISFFLKSYRIICILVISFFFYQVISFWIFGYRIPGIIPFLPFAIDMDFADFITRARYDVRSASFFSEPAHFVEFILPFLAIELFRNEGKKWGLIVIIILALLLTESGTALVGLAIILCMFVLYLVKESKYTIGKFLLPAICVAIFVAAASLYSDSAIGQRLLDRQSQIDVSGDSESKSAFLRMFRGFIVFSDYGAFEQIVGNDSPEAIKKHISSTNMEIGEGMGDNMYFNTFQTALLRTGYIGTVIFYLMLIGFMKKKDFCGKAIVMTLVCLSFISFMHFTESMAMYLILASCGGLCENNCSTKKNNI